jgi:hypothetical protein
MRRATELEAAVAGGYNHRGRQGYLYPVCSPEPACLPPGTVRVMRQCNPVIDDCAVFPESQLSLWLSRGYTQPMFSGGVTVLGYAYPNVDSDGDGLVDGLEHVIGSNPFAADSNGNGTIDGLEFPQAGVSFSDPCSGANTCLRRPQEVFADGFE